MLAELEQEQMIREAVATLPARCRLMIELLFFQHPPLPYADVAERLSWRGAQSDSSGGAASSG